MIRVWVCHAPAGRCRRCQAGSWRHCRMHTRPQARQGPGTPSAPPTAGPAACVPAAPSQRRTADLLVHIYAEGCFASLSCQVPGRRAASHALPNLHQLRRMPAASPAGSKPAQIPRRRDKQVTSCHALLPTALRTGHGLRARAPGGRAPTAARPRPAAARPRAGGPSTARGAGPSWHTETQG